jgi:hypothetical protein
MTSRRRRTRVTLTSTTLLLVVALGWWALSASGVFTTRGDEPTAATPDASTRTTVTEAAEPSRASRPSVTQTPGDDDGSAPAAAEARTTLATLPVKGSAPATGYDRVGDFGTAWLDVDHNGCDTRDDVLARDLSDVVRAGPCRVVTGELLSPYTGAPVHFVRGDRTSTLVQIDHVVALENAWRTGAQQLPQERREALANDPRNLLAVDQHSNAQKRSSDAATWLPASKAFRCTYVERQIAVKAAYDLWVVPAERSAMERVLAAC